ncbi:hypothetical protein Hanom_Chr16g01418461 [Helianthus anomalus]
MKKLCLQLQWLLLLLHTYYYYYLLLPFEYLPLNGTTPTESGSSHTAKRSIVSVSAAPLSTMMTPYLHQHIIPSHQR